MNYKTHISKEELRTYPIKKFEGKIVVVDTIDEVKTAVEHLSKSAYLGFDTETKPVFVKGISHKISLIQLANETTAYLFRVNTIALPTALQNLLEAPKCLKVGSAIKDDLHKVAELSTGAPFRPQGFVDIQAIASEMGIVTVGMKKLTAIVLNHTISKKQQVTNWEKKILSPGQINYAATDAWACFMLYKTMVEKG